MSEERAFIPDQFGEILDHGHGKTLRGVWKGRLDEFQGRSAANGQVLSLTQFYSVNFLQSRIGVKSAFSTNAQSRFASVVFVSDLLALHNTPDSVLVSTSIKAVSYALRVS